MQLFSFVSCTLSGLVFLVFFSYLNKWKALSGIPKRGDNLEKHSTNKSQHFPHTKLVVCPSVTIIIVPCYCRGTSRIRRGGPLTNSTSDVMRLKRGKFALQHENLFLICGQSSHGKKRDLAVAEVVLTPLIYLNIEKGFLIC